jgi:hypothetical protein
MSSNSAEVSVHICTKLIQNSWWVGLKQKIGQL